MSTFLHPTLALQIALIGLSTAIRSPLAWHVLSLFRSGNHCCPEVHGINFVSSKALGTDLGGEVGGMTHIGAEQCSFSSCMLWYQ